MGFLFVYHAVDEQTLDEMWRLDDGAFLERFQTFEEDSKLPDLHIGKVWDALHCVMTGSPASDPIEGCKLSECVVGVHPKVWEDNDYSTYIAVTENDEINEILLAVADYDAAKIRSILDVENLEKHKVYPKGIWNDPIDGLVDELASTLERMRAFYQSTMLNGHHIFASLM